MAGGLSLAVLGLGRGDRTSDGRRPVLLGKPRVLTGTGMGLC